jgi:hypothetical protein
VADRLHALAFNELSAALSMFSRFVPLSEREEITRRLVTVLRGEVDAEGNALQGAAREALAVYRTHAPKAHPQRLHDPDCDVCQMGVPLARDLPGTPDSIEAIRAWATAPETPEDA